MPTEASRRDESDPPLVTVAVIPRERYSVTQRTIEAIVANTTDTPHELMLVDADAPSCLRRWIDAAAPQLGIDVVRFDYFTAPNEARNEAIRRCRTRYLVIVDNDVLVEPGWLSPLIDTAERHGAAVVAPTMLHGHPKERVIHIAGGECRYTELPDGGYDYAFTQCRFGEKLDDVIDELHTTPCTMVELHCLLVRPDVLRRVGMFDERLLSFGEHDDLIMRLIDAGEPIYYEPRSLVGYLSPPPFEPEDLPYFFVRWSEAWNIASVDHFVQKWRLSPRNTWSPHVSEWLGLRLIKNIRYLGWFGRLAAWLRFRGWPGGRALQRAIVGRATRQLDLRRAAVQTNSGVSAGVARSQNQPAPDS